ncbi:MAG: roadblock/LC7 domain-containing protein [Promethearchaeota archaeon]|nr:MAG: roadblock/LC7 domain-containing protein [Candidatus Lokiarchaeota archaeon]
MENSLTGIKSCLGRIKSITGVENVVLTQRDGQPVESSGVWLSRNEIFGVCSIVSAVFNVAEQLHSGNLNYMLIDGERAKILIAPINSGNNFESDLNVSGFKGSEYFITITARLKVNLGAIMISMKDTIQSIGRIINGSGENFKPPLRSYDDNELKRILESFNVKEDGESQDTIDSENININETLSEKIRDCIFDFSKRVPGVKMASIALDGGYPFLNISLDSLNLQAEGALSYSLYDTSKRIISTLKKTPINNVLCECKQYSHFIYGIKKGIFSTFISSGQKRLGLLRLLIPQYVNWLSDYMIEASKIETPLLEIGNIFEDFK